MRRMRSIFWLNMWRFLPSIVGKYGAHCCESTGSRHIYMRSLYNCPPLWLCGHFTAKAVAVPLKRLAKEAGTKPGCYGSSMLLWHTKTCVQPRGGLWLNGTSFCHGGQDCLADPVGRRWEVYIKRASLDSVWCCWSSRVLAPHNQVTLT